MKRPDLISNKIFTLKNLLKQVYTWHAMGKTVAFTNGVFDLLHPGHLASLSEAAKQADCLIVAINSDASTKRLKGNQRPIMNEQSRAMLLAAMVLVDAVIIFEENTPLEIITALLPDVLVKGGDYTLEQIAGAKEIIANGGKVMINTIVEGFSTTHIIAKMKG